MTDKEFIGAASRCV